MAGEAHPIYACRYVSHNAAEITGVTHASVQPSTVSVEDPGDAGSPGPAESIVTNKRVDVVVYGKSYNDLLALVGATAADVVLGIVGAAGADEKITIKDVYFNSVPSEISVPPKDAGGQAPTCAIRGSAKWGADDTFATMIVAAADV